MAGKVVLGKMGGFAGAPVAVGRIGGVLMDLSGTLHIEDTPTPSAVAALQK